MHRKRRILSMIVVGVVAITALVVGGWNWKSDTSRSPERYLAVPAPEKAEWLEASTAYWHDRVTYPTGAFDPAWVRSAARQDARMASRVPAGSDGPHGDDLDLSRPEAGADDGLQRLLRLRLHRGPHQRDRGRPDDDHERLDRRLCRLDRRRRLEDDELLQHHHVLGRHDRRPADLHDRRRHAHDRPEQPQHDLRGHRRSQLRLLLDGQPGHPQVDRRRRDLDGGRARTSSDWPTPSHRASSRSTRRSARCASTRTTATTSSAGTKKGLFVSYNGGVDWTGPCTTNGFTTQRQDITGLELTDMGSGYAHRRRGRRARLRHDRAVRPRPERRERDLRAQRCRPAAARPSRRSPRTRTGSCTAPPSPGARTRPARP